MNTLKSDKFVFILAVILLVSCNKAEYDKNVKATPAIYGEVIPYDSGSAGLNWPSGQKLGVYMINPETSEDIYANVPHTASVLNNTFVRLYSQTQMYYPADGEKVDFIFYSPYQNVGNRGVISVSTTNQNVPSGVDLLYARGSGFSETTPSVPLTIEHILTRLLFKVETEINSKTVSVRGLDMKLSGIVSSGTFNLKTAELKPDTEKSSFGLLIDEDAAYQASAIVLPASSTTGIRLEVTVLQSGKAYVSDLSEVIKAFQPSAQHVFNVKLTNAGLAVTLGSSVEDWDAGNGGGEGIVVDKDTNG